MTQTDTPVNPLIVFRQKHHALDQLFRQREETLTKNAGSHALEYVLQPGNTAAQEQAVQHKACLAGMEMARDRFGSEVRYFEGTAVPDLLARCVRSLESIMAHARQEAEQAAVKVVDLPETDAKYREARLAILRGLHRAQGMRQFYELFFQVYGDELQAAGLHATAAHTPAPAG